MEEPFLMRRICYDSVLLDSRTKYDLFSDGDDMQESRVNNETESRIIEWFFRDNFKFFSYLFYEELSIPASYKPELEVSKPIVNDNSKPGDIDILMLDPSKPQNSIAFQVKRIKGRVEKEKTVLKTSHITDGVLQTKQMYKKYRFHQSYLMLVVVLDAQHHSHSQQMFRHLSYSDKKETIYEHSGYGDLPESTGIYILEISQPSVNSIDRTGRISAKMIRKATPEEQFNRTTEDIKTLLKSRRALQNSLWCSFNLTLKEYNLILVLRLLAS